jgi:prophage regulatory protein
MQKNTNQKILRLREVLSCTGMSRSMVYDLITKKQFPAPINLSARAVGWLEREVDAWIQTRIEESRGR